MFMKHHAWSTSREVWTNILTWFIFMYPWLIDSRIWQWVQNCAHCQPLNLIDLFKSPWMTKFWSSFFRVGGFKPHSHLKLGKFWPALIVTLETKAPFSQRIWQWGNAVTEIGMQDCNANEREAWGGGGVWIELRGGGQWAWLSIIKASAACPG